MEISRQVVTKARDQYGRKFGKKHASAMMEFTKSLWMQDATTSLRNIVKNEIAQVRKLSV